MYLFLQQNGWNVLFQALFVAYPACICFSDLLGWGENTCIVIFVLWHWNLNKYIETEKKAQSTKKRTDNYLQIGAWKNPTKMVTEAEHHDWIKLSLL